MINLPKEIQNNLQFLCVEIDSQLANMQLYFEEASPRVVNQILERVGYAYNLKTRIHRGVFNQIATNDLDNQSILSLRSVEFVANDLERISYICRSCVAEIETLESVKGLMPKNAIRILKLVQRAVNLIMPAIGHPDSSLAIKIGQIKNDLSQELQKLFQKNTGALKNNKHSSKVIATIYLAHEFKQMGVALVHISESIISAKLGQQVSFDRYFSLQSFVSEINKANQKIEVETVAETKSGTSISGIRTPESGSLGIYKSGLKQKLEEEKDGVKRWHEIYPGVAPKILSFQKKGGTAALLIEHLPGHTFEKIVLNESVDSIRTSLKTLDKTLSSIWTDTKIEKNCHAKFMHQLQKRLPDVYKIHPEFYKSEESICGQKLLSFDELIAKVSLKETQWSSPFSVYIHGDFNVDNIIFDPLEKRINFIDLHRSCYFDYVQDVSVFMISNYRLQIVDAQRRQIIMGVAKDMYAMSRRFALKHHDSYFDIRLALGLARSFASSTRFILDKSLAKNMFLRARYLIELVLAIDSDKAAKFRIPLKEIFVE
jgi:aminoglycoside phosphotransferase